MKRYWSGLLIGGTHYVGAINNGGSSVNATGTSVGSNQTFVYETDMH